MIGACNKQQRVAAMKSLKSGSIGIDHGEVVMFSDFEDDGEMWRGTGARVARKPVAFSAAFHAIPHVQLGIAMWDISNSSNSRVDLRAEAITEQGFEIVFRTWNDTQVARVRVTWTAIGALPNDDDWELY